MDAPFSASASVYDMLYAAAGKNYDLESEQLHSLIQRYRPGASSLLDVACGTGAHLLRLNAYYDVAGADLSAEMLREARRRLLGVALIESDMRTLRLDRTFDAVVCLFSGIGYMPKSLALDQSIQAMRDHLAPGGVLIVDGWVRQQSWRDPGTVQALSATSDGVAVARVVRSHRAGNHTTLELHHLVGSVDDVDYVVESHELTLFSDAEYLAAFERAGLRVEVVAGPHPDRDRYIGADALQRR